MLNELYKLSATLAKHNVPLQEWHGDYKPLPGGNCYRVWLRNDGSVATIELLDKALAAVCRKYGNNLQTFPAFNIAPLFRITSEEEKLSYDALEKGKEPFDETKLKAICTSDNWGSKLRKKIEGCLHKQIPGLPDGNAISVLMHIAKQMDGAALRTALENCVWERLPSDIKGYLPLLIHKGNKDKQPIDDAGSLSIMLDLADCAPYGNPIANENTTKQINEWLLSSKSTSGGKKQVQVMDAFGDICSPPLKIQLRPEQGDCWPTKWVEIMLTAYH